MSFKSFFKNLDVGSIVGTKHFTLAACAIVAIAFSSFLFFATPSEEDAEQFQYGTGDMSAFQGAWLVSDPLMQPHVETFGKTNVCTVYDELFAMEAEYDCSYEGSIMTRVSREDGSVQVLEITMVSENEFDAYVVEGKNAEITYHYASYYKTGDDPEKDEAF